MHITLPAMLFFVFLLPQAVFGGGRIGFTHRGWNIWHCNQGMRDSDHQISKLLDMIRTHVSLAAEDAKLGYSSTHGFPSLFKLTSSIPTVVNILEKIATAAPIELFDSFGIQKTETPSLACVFPGNPQTAKQLKLCVDRGISAGSDPNSKIIVVCPAFWSHPVRPSKLDCPGLEGGRAFPNDDRLIGNQWSILLNQLSYLYVKSQGTSLTVRNINDAINLNPQKSLLNTDSYGFYASSESSCFLRAR